MSLAELIADDEPITFTAFSLTSFLYLLLQPVGTKTPNGFKEQSLCHIRIAGWSAKHNFLLKRVLGGFKKCKNLQIVSRCNFFSG